MDNFCPLFNPFQFECIIGFCLFSSLILQKSCQYMFVQLHVIVLVHMLANSY